MYPFPAISVMVFDMNHRRSLLAASVLVAVILAAASLLSCRPPKQDPFVTMAKKYAAGVYLSLDDYYFEANGVKPGIKGIVLEIEQEKAETLMRMITTDFVFSLPFRIEKNYGKGGRKDKIAIVETLDQFELVGALRTHGKETGIDTDDIIRSLKKINSLAKIKLTGAGTDFVEFAFLAVPDDWDEVAAECASIAPDIVTYGTGTMEVLTEELRQYNKAVLWWF